MQQQIPVYYLHVGAPARSYGSPADDWFRFGPNNTIQVIRSDTNNIQFIHLSGVEPIRVYQTIKGNADSTVCEITGNDDEVTILSFSGKPALAPGSLLALLKDHCCEAGGGGDDFYVTIGPQPD